MNSQPLHSYPAPAPPHQTMNDERYPHQGPYPQTDQHQSSVCVMLQPTLQPLTLPRTVSAPPPARPQCMFSQTLPPPPPYLHEQSDPAPPPPYLHAQSDPVPPPPYLHEQPLHILLKPIEEALQLGHLHPKVLLALAAALKPGVGGRAGGMAQRIPYHLLHATTHDTRSTRQDCVFCRARALLGGCRGAVCRGRAWGRGVLGERRRCFIMHRDHWERPNPAASGSSPQPFKSSACSSWQMQAGLAHPPLPQPRLWQQVHQLLPALSLQRGVQVQGLQQEQVLGEAGQQLAVQGKLGVVPAGGGARGGGRGRGLGHKSVTLRPYPAAAAPCAPPTTTHHIHAATHTHTHTHHSCPNPHTHTPPLPPHLARKS